MRARERVHAIHAARAGFKTPTPLSPSHSKKIIYAIVLSITYHRCSYGYALFADLANRYSTDKLRFVRLDLGVWPSVGTVADVEVSAISGQLPSVITYERGQEERRVPSTRHKRKHIFSR